MKILTIIFILMFFLLNINIIKADVNVNPTYYQANQNLDVKVPCLNNNTYCSPSAVCNLTTIYPNNTVLINNQQMTNSLSYFNYTLTNSSLTTFGDYTNTIICKDGVQNGFVNFIFTITPNGKQPASFGFAIFIWIIFIIAVIGMFYTLIMSLIKLALLETGIYDILLSIASFFLMLIVIYLADNFLLYSFIQSWANVFILMGAITNVLVPIIAFLVSFIVNRMQLKPIERRELWKK